jgi:hypothetical protein
MSAQPFPAWGSVRKTAILLVVLVAMKIAPLSGLDPAIPDFSSLFGISV